MTLDNFVNALRDHYRQRPFRQFEIELASGTKVRVVHPDALSFWGTRAHVLTPDGMTHHLDYHSVVQVTSTDEPPVETEHAIRLPADDA